MTWVAVAVGGGAVLGAGASLISGGAASKAQQGAANSAMAEQQREYDTTRNDNAGSLAARNYGLAQMQNLADTYKSGPSQQDVLNSPGYQFGLTQGQNSVNQNAAATGSLYSGQQLKAAGAFNTNYATTKYDDQLNNLRNSQSDQFNRYASLSGQGQIGANAINQAGQNMANQNTSTLTSMGNAQGAADIGMGNSIGRAAGQAGAGLASWFSQPGTSYTTPNANGSYNNPAGNGGSFWNNTGYSGAQGYADGGPVRQEPVVGTRSPLPSSGAGPLSSQAIVQAILQRRAAQALRGPDVAQLPANPVTDPQAILADRMRQAGEFAHGGPVQGPGGPRDDAIPAQLSNGEHVFDAQAVNAIGGGDNALGQAKLNMLRAKLHGMH